MVDVDAQLTAVQRALETRGSGPDAIRVQSLVQDYRAELADVWGAVTEPERIRRWFLPVDGDLRVGGSYQLEGNAGGRVLECRPPSDGGAHYRITWAYGGAADSWVTVRLTRLEADRTRLELVHEARVADIPEEMWSAFGPGATGIGWDSILLGLALHLRPTADGVSPEEAAAWMVSTEGRRFARGSADAWAEAHVADGAAPGVAVQAANAIYELYTQPPSGQDGPA